MSTEMRARRLRTVEPGISSWFTGTVVAVLATLVVAATVLVAGPDTGAEQRVAPLPQLAVVADRDSDEQTEEITPVTLPVVAIEVVLPRDPFDPVVPEPEPVAQPDPAPIDPETGQPVPPPAPNGSPGIRAPGQAPTVGSCTGDVELVCNGVVLTLVDLFTVDGEDVALIQVDGTVYEVREGERFAGRFRLGSIDPPNVTIVYADQDVTLEPVDPGAK